MKGYNIKIRVLILLEIIFTNVIKYNISLNF